MPNGSVPQVKDSSAASLSYAIGGDAHTDDNRKAIVNQQLLQPDPITGALNYSYPLSVPPGRGNMTPDLGLTYSSQPSANSNTLGYEWSVTIPYIQRMRLIPLSQVSQYVV
jgi:hypothetical protein